MIDYLKLQNVGIKDSLELNIASRLNVLTGDNGLGKSFLLDILWFVLSGHFPQEINRSIQSGYVAKPLNVAERAFISVQDAKGQTEIYSYKSEEYWSRHLDIDDMSRAKAEFSDIAIYVMADGSYALWDRNLNNVAKHNGMLRYDGLFTHNRPLAFVYTQEEIWQGVNNKENNQFFNGLLQDWQIWQTGKTKEFKQLKSVLAILSATNEELEIGELKPFSLGDSRLYPTIKMPYGREILLPHCSSAIKRMVTLAYFLVYAWKRHSESSELLGKMPAKSLTFLVDEVEAHLHPKWQRKVVPSLLNVIKSLSKEIDVQLVIATHSPLVMASLEPIFNEKQDKWIDFDLNNEGNIEVSERVFDKQGTVENWLESEAFNLPSSRAPEYEDLINRANTLMLNPKASIDEINRLRVELVQALDERDEFWTPWLIYCQKRGVL